MFTSKNDRLRKFFKRIPKCCNVYIIPKAPKVEDQKCVIRDMCTCVFGNVQIKRHRANVCLFSVLFSFCQFKAWHPVLKLSISY